MSEKRVANGYHHIKSTTEDESKLSINIKQLSLNCDEAQKQSSTLVGGKRSNYLQWDDYFMSVAFLSAQRSKDPVTQVGACIVDTDNKIVGIGYNGMPNGCDDDMLPWGKTDNWLDSKYPYVCHAEMNAILNRNASSVKNCKLYVALFPCNDCAKLIIQSGITKVLYYSDKHKHKDSMIASRRLLDLAGIEYKQYIPKQEKVIIDFSVINS